MLCSLTFVINLSYQKGPSVSVCDDTTLQCAISRCFPFSFWCVLLSSFHVQSYARLCLAVCVVDMCKCTVKYTLIEEAFQCVCERPRSRSKRRVHRYGQCPVSQTDQKTSSGHSKSSSLLPLFPAPFAANLTDPSLTERTC